MIKKNAKSSTVTRLKGGSIIDIPPQLSPEELIPTINDRLRRINQAAADTRAIAQASPAGLQVLNNGALPASTQAALNLIPGANVTISSVANPDKKRTDVTISSASPPNTIEVDKAGVLVGTRGKVNLIEGANVTLTVADNPGASRVDVTIAAAGGGGAAPAGTPIYRGTTRNSTNSGWSNFTIWARFNGSQLSSLPANIKAVISVLGGTGISIAKAALIVTPIQSTVITSNIPITFGGAASLVAALSPPVNVTTDAIAVTLDLLHDYYLIMYLDGNAYNGGVGLMCGDVSYADPPSAGWGGGDNLTGIAAAPVYGAGRGWTGWWTLLVG